MEEDLKTRLAKFKHEPHHGVFYPKGYVVTFFADADQEKAAQAALSTAGWPNSDLIPFTGVEILQLNQEIRSKQGGFEKFISGLLEEREALEQHLDHARQGHVALCVYAGNEGRAKQIRTLIEPYHPLLVQSYAPLFVVDM